jgi:hypothetical protein
VTERSRTQADRATPSIHDWGYSGRRRTEIVWCSDDKRLGRHGAPSILVGECAPTGDASRVPLGGMSGLVLETGARLADIYATWGVAQQFVSEVSTKAIEFGRTPPRFHISLRVILRNTEASAWRRAEEIGDAIEERTTSGSNDLNRSGRRVGKGRRAQLAPRARWSSPTGAMCKMSGRGCVRPVS